MFLVLNTSGLTIVPVSIMVYRAQLGAANPTDIFIPILLANLFFYFGWFDRCRYLSKDQFVR